MAAADIYTTASPCWSCFRLIANSSIRRIYYGEFYRDERSREVARELGMELVDLSHLMGERGSELGRE